MTRENVAALLYWIGLLLIIIGASSKFGFDAGTITLGAGLIGFVVFNRA